MIRADQTLILNVSDEMKLDDERQNCVGMESGEKLYSSSSDTTEELYSSSANDTIINVECQSEYLRICPPEQI